MGNSAASDATSSDSSSVTPSPERDAGIEAAFLECVLWDDFVLVKLHKDSSSDGEVEQKEAGEVEEEEAGRESRDSRVEENESDDQEKRAPPKPAPPQPEVGLGGARYERAAHTMHCTMQCVAG